MEPAKKTSTDGEFWQLYQQSRTDLAERLRRVTGVVSRDETSRRRGSTDEPAPARATASPLTG